MTHPGRKDHFVDLVGRRFGKLVAIKRAPKVVGQKPMFKCVCDCGKIKVVTGRNLRRGMTKSCGCIGAALDPHWLPKGNFKHGGKGTREYVAWKQMRSRCHNKRNKAWANYGGRGIKICEAWADFDVFRRDVGPAPAGHSLDRIDVNGDYTPQNCRWATAKAQCRNKRNNRLVAHNGETKTLAEWADDAVVDQRLVRTRYVRYGWSLDTALYTPRMFTPKKKPRSPRGAGA